MERIGLALSGGGFRATAFHLGVLSRLADDDLLGKVAVVSTVSGGSLCMGLVLAANGYKWPQNGDEYRKRVLPEARRLLTLTNIKLGLIGAVVRHPRAILESRAGLLAAQIESEWGIRKKLHELPATPVWIINATCYESGANWRFSRAQMGDYRLGRTRAPRLPIARAMAASAGFPGLVGPLVLDRFQWQWEPYEDEVTDTAIADTGVADVTTAAAMANGVSDKTNAGYLSDAPSGDNVGATVPRKVHLWDGGVYDNLGLEALHKPGGGHTRGLDYVIASDAAGQRRLVRDYPTLWRPDDKLDRLLGIAKAQIEGLRARDFVAYLRRTRSRAESRTDSGCYLRIGNVPSGILRDGAAYKDLAGAQFDIASLPPPQVEAWLADAEFAKQMGTDIRPLEVLADGRDEFRTLHDHGYTVADYTLFAYSTPGTVQLHPSRPPLH